MKLAIVVVYLVGEEYEWLLDLHLERIRLHTTAPYRIYGSAVRLSTGARQRLAREPDVLLLDLPQTELRGAGEHSFHLEQLVSRALDEGMSHVVMLHVDSFPVRDGWEGELANHLSAQCAFVSTPGINTACLLFERGFHIRCRPTLLVPESRRDDRFREYVRAARPNDHSGIGYGFCAWNARLSWHEIDDTTDPAAGGGGSIYGDVVFHLKGAVRLASPAASSTPWMLRLLGEERMEWLLGVQRRVVPERLRNGLRARMPGVQSVVDDSRIRREREAMVRFRDELRADPEEAIRRLRGR